MASVKKKILIVEDEYFLAEMIQSRLRAQGYETSVAEDGGKALDFLKKEKVDLILMDVMMPVMNGWETAKRIKADETLKQIPVVFLTVLARHEDHMKAHEVGGQDYLSKPFEMEDLVRMVKKWTSVAT